MRNTYEKPWGPCRMVNSPPPSFYSHYSPLPPLLPLSCQLSSSLFTCRFRPEFPKTKTFPTYSLHDPHPHYQIMMTSDSDSDPHANLLANSTHDRHHSPSSPASTAKYYTYRSPVRRRLYSFRRRRLPTVRLGGKKPRFLMARAFRRVKMRSLKIKLCLMIKKLKAYCRNLSKDIFESGGTIDAIQQRMIFETGFAIPVMGGITFNSLSLNHHMA